MKKLIFIITIGLTFTLRLEAKKIKGQIIFKNDTVNVIMKIPIIFVTQEPNFEKLQYKLIYIDSLGEKKTLTPDDAVEFRFFYDNDTIRMLSIKRPNGLGIAVPKSSNIFLHLKEDGDLKLFKYFHTQRFPGAYSPMTGMMSGGSSFTDDRYLLQKGDNELKEIILRKKYVIQYFSDCPELQKKIKNRKFRKSHFELIVRYYNKKCK